jgi:hypothetical protein
MGMFNLTSRLAKKTPIIIEQIDINRVSALAAKSQIFIFFGII